ncbi:MAG: thymidine kinase [Candidatus Marinimicrobia bacterium]|nr:thymidine kinase [Candidatus Neomarinimicrobiota bacterium]MCF7851255.1 thymidine kinase [Candidatus Neomarinimicrobiota bacterium]MCF7905510.1 thymidine kinase [Candidatus Neomarinimicrobiota bacterium]
MEHLSPHHTGWIEVITGSMFSGKTEELIRRLRRAQIARQHVAIFKPDIDNRFSEDHIVSHSQQKLESTKVKSAVDILPLAKHVQVVGIDEAQFFDEAIIDVCRTLAKQKKRVIVAGLEKDFRAEPFGPMPQLIIDAEYVTKNLAICVVCGNPAGFTQRLINKGEQIMVGEAESYEARCRSCYDEPED